MTTSTSVHLPKLLLKFCRDIAAGMSYLSEKLFVHRDLAARNILLSKELSCKVCICLLFVVYFVFFPLDW